MHVMFDKALRNRDNEMAAIKLSGTFETRHEKGKTYIQSLTGFSMQDLPFGYAVSAP